MEGVWPSSGGRTQDKPKAVKRTVAGRICLVLLNLNGSIINISNFTPSLVKSDSQEVKCVCSSLLHPRCSHPDLLAALSPPCPSRTHGSSQEPCQECVLLTWLRAVFCVVKTHSSALAYPPAPILGYCFYRLFFPCGF